MERPVLSPDFTIEDIRKLRDYNSYRHSQMTAEEIMADTAKGANEVLKHIAELRKARLNIQ